MDQPFEREMMDALAAESEISSAESFDQYGDQYSELDEASFDENDFGDGMDEFAAEDANSLDESAFDDFEGDLWNEFDQSGDEFREHDSNQRESNRGRHEKGQRRRRVDRGGEAGDDRRQLPRRRPPGHRGPWPPRANSFSDEMGDSIDALEEEQDSFLADDAAEMNSLDAMADAIADALDAQDSSEFLRLAQRGLRQAARAQSMPRSIAQAANLAGRLVADGADEFEALEEFLNFAETEDAIDAAMPMIAGLAVRSRMPRAARLPRPIRRQLVRSVSRSGRALTQRQGRRSIRAIPPVVQAVQRTAARQRLPIRELPQAISRTTARLIGNPQLVDRLLLVRGSTIAGGCSCRACRRTTQRLILNGPVEIVIRR